MTPVSERTGQTLVYKRGWRAFLLLAGLGALVGTFFIARFSLEAPRLGQRIMGGVGFILSGAMGLGGLWLAIAAAWTRIYPDGRFEVPSWPGRTASGHLREFEGFRLFAHNGAVWVHLVRPDRKRTATLPLSLLAEPSMLGEWLEAHLPSLDLQDLEREQQQIIAQHTSDQDDPATILHHLQKFSSVSRAWLVANLFGTFVLRARRPELYDAWGWLIIDASLLLTVLMAAELARYRHLVTVDQRAQQFRPAIMSLVMVMVSVSLAHFRHLTDWQYLSLPTLAIALAFALPLTSLPGAPDIRHRERVGLFLGLVLCASFLPPALNASLPPHAAHTFHTASVTEVSPAQHGFRIHWRYDQLAHGSLSDDRVSQSEPPAVGAHIQVEMARGALGWHWVVGLRRLDPPGAP